MSLRYLLDTNVCVQYLKSEFGIGGRVWTAGLANYFLSEITIAKLLFGIANSAPSLAGQAAAESGWPTR